MLNLSGQNQIKTELLLEQSALVVLESKCNICHKKRNPNLVFTKDNMEKYFRSINIQVFVWERMPQGNEIVLTESDKKDLKAWILFLKSKN